MPRRMLVIPSPTISALRERGSGDRLDPLQLPPAIADLLQRRLDDDRPGHSLKEVIADLGQACRHVSSAVEQGEGFAAVFIDMGDLPPEEASPVLADLWLADPRLPVVMVCGRHCPTGCACRLLPVDPRLVMVRGTDALTLADDVAAAWSRQAVRRKSLLKKLRLLRQRNQRLREKVERQRRDAVRLRRSALHDTLTSLPNRALMMDRLNRCIARAARDPDYLFAILFLDIDEFKFVNDSLGHEVGDAVLLEVSRRLTRSLRQFDTVSREDDSGGGGSDLPARLGGDEFVIVLDKVASPEDAVRVAKRLQQQLAASIMLPGRELAVTTSMGVTIGRGGSLSASALLREADSAMYRAKLNGKGRTVMFDSTMHAAATQRQKMEKALRAALERNELEVVYQPVVALKRFKVQGFEALLRWHAPDFGTVGPNEFIPLAEEMGLILPIQRWVLDTVLRQLHQWNLHPGGQRVWASVNISSRQFEQPGFADQVLNQAEVRGLDPHLLMIELKQSCLRRCGPGAVAPLTLLRDRGVQICIDDFGSIPSSLADLRQLPVDLLKIDRGVATTFESSHDWAAIVQAMTTLAHALHKRVVVEGIETSQQMQQVDQMACDYAQGYFFARPLSAEAASKFIQSPPRWRLSA